MTDARLFAIAHSLKAIMESRPAAGADSATLIKEAFVATFGKGVETDLGGQKQFYSSAARAMRRFLVDQGRATAAASQTKIPPRDFTETSTAKDAGWSDILAVDAAIGELEKVDARSAHIALLHYFGGLSEDECALAVGGDRTAVHSNWIAAVSFVRTHMAKSA